MREEIAKVTIIVVMIFVAIPIANSQWVSTNGPILAGKGYSGATEGFGVIDSTLFAGTEDPAGLGGGTSLTTDFGVTWHETNGEMQYTISYAVIACNGVLFAATGTGLYRSTDNGSSWNQSGSMNYLLSLAANGNNVFAGTAGYGVYISADSGALWTPINKGLPSNAYISAIAVSGSNIFAATVDSGVYISTNSGANWTPTNTGLTNLDLNCLTPVGTNLYAGTGGGIFLSTNNGTSWANIYSGSIIYSIVSSGNYLFAGGENGVMLSTNDGKSWSSVDSGLTYNSVLELAVDGPYIFAGVNWGDGGVWRRPLSDFNQSGVAESAAGNSDSTLRIFPNPASNQLQIMGGSSIGKDVAGTVHLFDLLGRERLNAPLLANSATLDVASLPPGMYFVSDGHSQSKFVKQ